jgi:hypothetical protein
MKIRQPYVAKKEMKVRIFGGLGNQIFQYYYGQYLNVKFDYNIEYDMSWISSQKKIHPGNIHSFVAIENLSSLGQKHSKLSNLLHNAFLSRRAILKFFRLILEYSTNIHISPSIGFSLEDCQPRKNKKEAIGYFQTWKYFKESGEKIPMLNQSSNWLKKQIEIFEKTDSVGVHIRRGDYKQNATKIGLLDLSYFEELIKNIHEGNPSSTFFIFTDEEEKIKLNLPRYIKCQQILPPSETEPLESLILLSKCKVICLSNSTFSYWAAMFANPNSKKYIPNKWFRGMPDPVDLAPRDWVRIDSRWQQTLSE